MSRQVTGQLRVGGIGNPPRALSRAHARHPDQDWSVPLSVTLPVSLLVSLAIWAGLLFAARTLFF